MRVTVKLYGHLPDLAGQGQFNIEVNEPTVKGLLQAMQKSCPRDLMSAMVDFQSDPPELLVMASVDNMPTFYAEGIESKLREGSEVVFMPALAGGSAAARSGALPRARNPVAARCTLRGRGGYWLLTTGY